jgi:hypothetical protein
LYIPSNNLEQRIIEINELTAAKKNIEKQWEEALAAMAKRDDSFEAIENQQRNLKSQHLDSTQRNRALRKELEMSEKKLLEKNLRNTIQYITVKTFLLIIYCRV